MIHIALVLAVWLILLGSTMETANFKSTAILKVPCFIFGFIVGLWYCKQTGLI